MEKIVNGVSSFAGSVRNMLYAAIESITPKDEPLSDNESDSESQSEQSELRRSPEDRLDTTVTVDQGGDEDEKAPVKEDIYESKESEDMESETITLEVDDEPEVESTSEKTPRNYLTAKREQELRVLLRGLGAQPKLSAADTSVMRIMRRALEEGTLSKSNEGLIKTYCYYLDEQKDNSTAPAPVPYAIGGIPCNRKQMISHINDNIPDNGLGDVSGAMNDMELGRGKATTGYAGVLHASAGKKGAKGGCTLFFTRDGQGNVDLVGVGQHTSSSSYEIFWSSVGMPNNIQL